MSYDSRSDTLDHIVEVRNRLLSIADDLRERGRLHDASKLQEPEKSLYDEWVPKLKELTYGSDEYKAALAEMGEALRHHYWHNSHHPEYYPGGVDGMSLMDVIEMLCDWAAAVKRQAGDNPTTFDELMTKAIKHNCKRFSIERQLGIILANTAKDLGWIEHR